MLGVGEKGNGFESIKLWLLSRNNARVHPENKMCPHVTVTSSVCPPACEINPTSSPGAG